MRSYAINIYIKSYIEENIYIKKFNDNILSFLTSIGFAEGNVSKIKNILRKHASYAGEAIAYLKTFPKNRQTGSHLGKILKEWYSTYMELADSYFLEKERIRKENKDPKPVVKTESLQNSKPDEERDLAANQEKTKNWLPRIFEKIRASTVTSLKSKCNENVTQNFLTSEKKENKTEVRALQQNKQNEFEKGENYEKFTDCNPAYNLNGLCTD